MNTSPHVDTEVLLDANKYDPTGRLAAYLAGTQVPLDILALSTLFIVVVPAGDFGTALGSRNIAVSFRLVLSLIYAVDATIRARLAQRPWLYLRKHPVTVLSAIAPPVRVLFSFRLIRSLFRRGHLSRFLMGASVLLMNGAAIVYFLERDVRGANIRTFGVAVWWSVVTVTTVGYGDYYPVTTGGRITAGFIMGIGILTLAVITAQVSSSFVDQAARNRALNAGSVSGGNIDEVNERLARIEALLASRDAES